jgi:SAM-dependent methyltransferase
VSIDVSGIKQGQRMMWSTGNYPEVARRIESVAELLAERVGAGPGVEMLDVATGSGNVAIAAAQRGANVTGLDLTPELLEAARRRAAEADLDVRFIEGDAEELPFETTRSIASPPALASCSLPVTSRRKRACAGRASGWDDRVHRLDSRGTDWEHVQDPRVLHANTAPRA